MLATNEYGIYAECGNSGETGDRHGGRFYSRSQDYSYGVYASAYGYSVDPAYGIRGYGSNNSSGNAYGGYFSTSTLGTGTHYGVFAEADDYPVRAEYSPDPLDHYAYLSNITYGIYTRTGNTDDTTIKYGGRLRAYSQGTTYGVYANAYGYGAGNSYAVYGYATGNRTGTAYGIYNASGTKSWVNPDPEDPEKSVVYVTVESGENATYYSGRARLVDGIASVTLPDHFRKVTSPDHPVTVQVTPRSADSMGLAVVESDNTGFAAVELMGGMGDYEFDYTVKGLRLGYEEHEPIIDNVDYVPFQGNQADLDETETTTQEWYDSQLAGVKKILKKNGTLDQEGKVNDKMFKEKGWKNVKEKKPRPAFKE
jgi:hypothetical protein